MLDTVALGKRISHTRQQRGLTQGQLANGVRLSLSHLGNIERGTRAPSLETLVNIANFLRLSPDRLLRDSLDQALLPQFMQWPENERNVLRSLAADHDDVMSHWFDEVDEDEEQSIPSETNE